MKAQITREAQDAIRDLCIAQTGCTTIDGGGCDSGDPLDFTLSEINQALVYLLDQQYDAHRLLSEIRDRLNNTPDDSTADWYHQTVREINALLAAQEKS